MRSFTQLRIAFVLSVATIASATPAFAGKTIKGVSRQPQALTKPDWKEQQAIYNHVVLSAQNHGISSPFITSWQAGEHSNSRMRQQIYVTVASQPVFFPMGASAPSTGTAPTREAQLQLVRGAASAAPARTSIMPMPPPPLYQQTWSATINVRREPASKKAGLVKGKLKSVSNGTGWQESTYYPPPPIPLNATGSTP